MSSTQTKMLFIGEPLVEYIATRQPDGQLSDMWSTGAYVGDVAVNMPSYTLMAAEHFGLLCSITIFTAVGPKGDIASDECLEAMQKRGFAIHSDIKRISGKTLGKVINLKDPDGTPSTEKLRAERKDSAYRNLLDNVTAADLAKISQGYTDIVVSGVSLACVRERQKLVTILEQAKKQNPSVQITISTNLRHPTWQMPDLEDLKGLAPQDEAWRSKAMRWFDRIIPLADTIFANLTDERNLRGCASSLEVEQELRKLNSKATIVVTDDANPISVFGFNNDTGRTALTLPVSVPEKIIDTVGAGDSFAGTYLVAVKAGLEPQKAARMASSVAAQVVGFNGALPKPGQSLVFDA